MTHPQYLGWQIDWPVFVKIPFSGYQQGDHFDWVAKNVDPARVAQLYSTGQIYHNKEFVAKCASLGLHIKPGEGWHLKLADGPFEQLMNELGIEKPKERPKGDLDKDWFKWLLDFKGKKRKGRSTLSKWSCGCQNARIGTKEFHAVCTKEECGNVFVRADKENVYNVKEKK